MEKVPLFANCPFKSPTPVRDSEDLLDPQTQPQFVQDLPNPLDPSFIFEPDTKNRFRIDIVPFLADLGLIDPVNNRSLMTPMWGYSTKKQGPTYPGRTFIVKPNCPIRVKYRNKLNKEEHLLTIDPTIHWANPRCPPYPKSGVPLVTHLHGGLTPYLSDGNPDAWFTPDNRQVGRLFNPIYTYPNRQSPATLWYHDHALGITRLNVYAGLAGFYLIRGEIDKKLPQFPYEVPIVIQDKEFNSDGSLFYPSSITPEFFGRFIVVNGKIWPRLRVEPRWYRFRLLNGSDSRFYTLSLVPSLPLIVIGSDQGFLVEPAPVNELTIGPGERYDILIDFSTVSGQKLILINTAPTPFPDGDPPDPETSGKILSFEVEDSVRIPFELKLKLPEFPTLPPVDRVRQLILMETSDIYGRLEPVLGTVENGGYRWDDPTTETPKRGTVEIWEVYNTTPDTHPIHLHGVSFLAINRQNYTAKQNSLTGALTDIQLIGPSDPPLPVERGHKDTLQMNPGQVTRILVPFTLSGEYVWHCHILSHEDHDMMRRIKVS